MATPEDAIAAMEDVCLRRAKAICAISPKGYDGLLTFELSTGWVITLYARLGIWFYVDRIVAPDGTVLDHTTRDPDDPREWHPCFDWSPHGEFERPHGDMHGSGEMCRHWGDWGLYRKPDGG